MEESLFGSTIDKISSFTDMRGRPNKYDISESQFMATLDTGTESGLVWHYMGLSANEFERIPVGVHMWLLDVVMSERHRHVVVGSISMNNYINLYLEQGFGIARNRIANALFNLSQERHVSYGKSLTERIFDERIYDKSHLVYELIIIMMDFVLRENSQHGIPPKDIIDFLVLQDEIDNSRVKNDVKDLWNLEISKRLAQV